MANILRSLLSRYKSISRPSVFSGGSSTYFSVAKKQLSAEDAIIDDQYDTGNLSAESYLLKLRERLGRVGLTPLQTQTLTEKMRNVQGDVTDAAYSNAYQRGDIETSDMYVYEKAKLDKMTEPGSEAYIKQEQKVQGLLDKAEREVRADARRSEMLRISQMPEDTSERVWAKAQLYDQLEQQARLDGDNDTADTLATQKNNYYSSAKRADINDLITGTKLQVSETFGAGAGIPSAEGGASLFSELTGGKTGFTTPAVKNALESLDRQKKSLDRLYQTASDKESMIATYKDAISKATGDQKTQLTIALNNLESGLADTNNQISNTTQNITDTVMKVQELNGKAAASAFRQEVRKNNSEFDKAETDLEGEFKKGKINKVEYITKGIELAQTKAMFFDQASTGFSQFGDDASADTYLDKTNQAVEIHESLVNIGQNLDDYEPIFVDKDSSLTNLFGEKIRKGDVVLQDVRQLKDSGRWGENYANVEGVFHRIQYDQLPPEYLDADGFLISGLAADKSIAMFMNNAYVYTVKDGKVGTEKIKFLQSEDGVEAVTETRANKLVDDGAVIRNQQGGLVWKPQAQESGLLKAAAKTQEVLQNTIPGYKDYVQKVQGIPENIKSLGQKAITPVKNVMEFYKNYYTPIVQKGIETAKNVFQKGKEFASSAIAKTQDIFRKMNIFNPPLVSGQENEYSFVAGTPDEYKQDIIDASKESGISTEVLSSLLKSESNFNPNAVSAAGAIGIAQIMPGTARELGIDPNDPSQAIHGAAKYLKQNLDATGDMKLAIAAYNAGLGAVRAAGNKVPLYRETQNYVQRVLGNLGNTIKEIFLPMSERTDYTDEQLPDPRKVRNIELALGLQPGQYRKGLRQDQGAVDRAFRSNDPTMIQLMKDEGFNPSWESKPTPAAQSQPQQQQSSSSSWNPPKIEIPKIAQKATTAVKSYFTPTSNQGQNFWSTPVAKGLANVQSSIQKYTAPVVNKVQQTVSNVKNWFSNLFKKK